MSISAILSLRSTTTTGLEGGAGGGGGQESCCGEGQGAGGQLCVGVGLVGRWVLAGVDWCCKTFLVLKQN